MGLETLVEWPERDVVYKIVQFVVDDKPYLRFSNHGEEYHKNIVISFAKEIGVEPREVVKKSTTLYLLPKEERFKITGMGRCELKMMAGKRRAVFYGRSTDYLLAGIDGIDQRHLDLIMSHFPNISIRYDPKRWR